MSEGEPKSSAEVWKRKIPFSLHTLATPPISSFRNFGGHRDPVPSTPSVPTRLLNSDRSSPTSPEFPKSKSSRGSALSLAMSVQNRLGTDACVYEPADTKFLEERELQSNALGPWGLFILFASSGMCIANQTSWNPLLEYGFGTVLVATALAFISYTSFVCIMIELMVMLPFNGGMAVFARTAFGPFAGFIIGSCEAWEYILFSAQGFFMIGTTCSQIFQTDPNLAPLYWLPFAVLVIGVSYLGVRPFAAMCGVLLFIDVVGGICLMIPSLFYFNPIEFALDDALNLMNQTSFNITTSGLSTEVLLFPQGISFLWPAMVTMLWAVSGLEMAPLCAEEGQLFVANSPRLLLLSMLAMYFIITYAVVLVPCVPPGISELISSNNPIIDALLASYGFTSLTDGGIVARCLYFFLFVPDILLYIAIYLYATSRQIFALSKVGYYPTLMSKVTRKVPIRSMLFALVMCMGSALLLQFESSAFVGTALQNASLLYALFAYIVTGCVYLQMRWNYPHLRRPFNLGPVVGPLLAIITIVAYTSALVQLFFNEPFQETLILCLSKLGVMLLLFIFWFRKRMVETPEELFIQKFLGTRDSNGNKLDAGQFIAGGSQDDLKSPH